MDKLGLIDKADNFVILIELLVGFSFGALEVESYAGWLARLIWFDRHSNWGGISNRPAGGALRSVRNPAPAQSKSKKCLTRSNILQ